jgi:anti-sigma regulatory factor (Ser/Thr protein kinase)
MGGNPIASETVPDRVRPLRLAPADADGQLSARAVLESVQRALLPRALPSLPGVTVDARYLPGSCGLAFAGDWYDACTLPDGRLFLAAGDVVGRGPAAASTMGRMRGALQAYALDGVSPRGMLERLNRQTDDLGTDDVASVVVVTFDPADGRATVANAGHPPPAMRDPYGNVSFASGPGGPPIGATSRAQFHQHEVVLAAGSTLVLYTDGLVEQRGEPLDAGLARLADALARGPQGATALTEHLVGSLDPLTLRDDIAVLVVAIDEHARPLRVRFPARLRALRPMRHSLAHWLVRSGIDERTQSALVVAVNEAVANAIEHAYPPAGGEVQLDATIHDGVVEVVVEDEGHWREVPRGTGGLGLQLMRRLVDDVDVRSGAEGTVVRLRMHVTAEAAVLP